MEWVGEHEPIFLAFGAARPGAVLVPDTRNLLLQFSTDRAAFGGSAHTDPTDGWSAARSGRHCGRTERRGGARNPSYSFVRPVVPGAGKSATGTSLEFSGRSDLPGWSAGGARNSLVGG